MATYQHTQFSGALKTLCEKSGKSRYRLAQRGQPGGTGLVRLLWPGGNGLGGTGESLRETLDHRGVF